MITCRQTAALLDARLQERLRRFEACVLRCDPVSGTAPLHELQQRIQEELRNLSALAIWIRVPGLQEQLQVLDKLVKGLMLVEGSTPERILFHLFRALQRLLDPVCMDLQRLLQQRVALLDAGRQTGLAEPGKSRACPLALLQQAGQFLGSDASPGGVKALLVGQDSAREQLHRVLHYRMQELAEACSHNEWTLEACARSGLARKTRQLVQLAAFARGKLQADLGRLEQFLLRLHVHGGVDDQVAALLHLLQGLILGRNMAVQLAFVLAPTAMQDQVLVSDEETQAELIAVSESIRKALPIAEVGEGQVSASLLQACNRLGWMLDALGHYSLGLAGHALAHACLQYWQWRQPLTASMLDTVQQFLHALQDQLEGYDYCCQKPECHLASSFLAECPEYGQGSVTATAIALDLANQFEILAAVRQAIFASRASFLQQSQFLLKELRLLEQGAAAVRLRPLEQFTSLLLDMHHLLAVEYQGSDFPADLLWQSHQQLLAMLDAAALWLEPLPDQELMRQMTEWVRNTEMVLVSAAANLSVVALHNSLQVALTAFARKAGNLLGRSARLTLSVKNIGVAQQLEIVPVVTELLRWLLLQGAVDSNEGISQPRTRSLDVQIQCCLLPDARIQAVVTDDTGGKLPDQAMRRRLQRLFPTCGITLKAELQQHGKRRLELEFIT